eukprot:NODE_412_length_1974_cov_68.882512_g405_i0.p1 GENE.NODE_412_length_1974_cov_68.882512_g405_i0~~NODE_412_length_1974_cov_68.882512_g405_i0.p1  ORF type:complete len:414 (-),score=81.65 NODE_412_length_1974_cov_68.882512_g405_i0:31-1272(-)
MDSVGAPALQLLSYGDVDYYPWAKKPRGYLHHDIQYSPITNTFMALHRWVDKSLKPPVLYDDILEVSPQGKIMWVWNGSTELPFQNGTDQYGWTSKDKHPDSDCVDFRVGWCRDWMHGNTVFFDEGENMIYYNAKHTDSFWKIDRATGKVVWAVGKFGGFKLYNKNGDEVKELFLKAHGIERIGPNRFIIFDNLFHGDKKKSRWLEMVVDPEAKTAREVAYWVAPPHRYSHQMGDADRLPNGNTLMSITTTGSLTESHPDGDIAWELTFPMPKEGKGGKWWIYHAEKFMLTPRIRLRMAEPAPVSEGVVDLSVSLWNTVRVRYRAMGTLTVHYKRQLLLEHKFQFEVNWIETVVTTQFHVPDRVCDDFAVQVTCTNNDGISQQMELQLSRPPTDDTCGEAAALGDALSDQDAS